MYLVCFQICLVKSSSHRVHSNNSLKVFEHILHLKDFYSHVPCVLSNLPVKSSSQRVHLNNSLEVFEHILHLKDFYSRVPCVLSNLPVKLSSQIVHFNNSLKVFPCTLCTFKSILTNGDHLRPWNLA